MLTIWILLIFAPNEAAGRQVGPFSSYAQCVVAERAYNARHSIHLSPQSKCVEALIKT